ncbi:MAG: ATP synthase subunit I [Deltaproteobacteria bacterium]|nr:ATP synthase subunit I [Deltaproteobacteria bacterium]
MNDPTIITSEEALRRNLVKRNWIILAAMLLSSLIFFPFSVSCGILAGGLLAIANFHLLYRILRKALNPDTPGSPVVVVIKYYLRLIATGAILFILIFSRQVNVLAIILGLSVVVINLGLLACSGIKDLLASRLKKSVAV